jgi:hypothetical protein
VAVVGTPPVIDAFAALVASNRGVTTETFSDTNNAIAWLNRLLGVSTVYDPVLSEAFAPSWDLPRQSALPKKLLAVKVTHSHLGIQTMAPSTMRSRLSISADPLPCETYPGRYQLRPIE